MQFFCLLLFFLNADTYYMSAPPSCCTNDESQSHPTPSSLQRDGGLHLCSSTPSFLSWSVFFFLLTAWWIMCNSLCVFMRQSLQSVCDALTKGETIVYSLIGLPLPPVLVKLQKFHCSVAMAPWKICLLWFPLSLQDSYSLYLYLLTSQRNPLWINLSPL